MIHAIGLDLRWTFPLRLILANINVPILGADFLWHYRLLVDMQHMSLITPESG